VYECDKARTER